jgi:outer membrane protein assembly factor BamB
MLMLVCAIIGAGITALLPRAFSAHASGGATLTLNPTSAPYTNRDDQNPIVVNGKNFGANETVKVYWNYTGPGTGTLEATTTTDATGTFSTNFYILDVLSPTGNYTMAGVGQTSGTVATATFTLLPQLYVRAQAGGSGSPTTVIGNAFGAYEAVKIYWNYISSSNPGKLLTTVNGDANGSFTVGVNVPNNATPGFYQFAGVGQTSNQVSKYKYTVNAPTLALAPLQGSPNSGLTVSAYGFQGLEGVDIYWDNNATPVASSTTSDFGYLAPTSIPVPSNAAAGPHTVKMVGSTSGITITNTYTVLNPASGLSITSGPVGVKVKVSGQGYAPQETVNILWNYTGPGTGTKAGSTTAGYSGAVQGSFSVPRGASGAYTVALVGASSNSVTQNTFTLSNGLAASPNSNSPGKSVAINGTGFLASESVQLFLDSTSGKLLATATANAHGSISKLVTIPSGASAGNHNIIGVGQTSGQSYSAAITVNTNWGDFGFDNQHDRNNPNEHGVGTKNVANLQLKWSATTASGLEASPVYAKGIVYIPTMDGFLNAYDATTGSLLWQFNCQCIFRSFSSPLVDPATGMVFWGTVGYADEGIPSPFYALDAQSGTLLWSEILNWHQLGFPTVAFNTLYIGTSHLDHIGSSIYAIDEASGTVRWQYNYDAGFWGAVAADLNTNTVFTGVGNGSASQDAAVEALNASTGAVIWRTTIAQLEMDDDVGSGITLAKGLVYASSKNGSVYALNEADGSIVWSTPISGPSSGDISTQAVSASGTVYVGSMDDNLYALKATTGAVLWKTHTGARIFSSPAIANGVVYFSSFDHKVYAVNAKSGAVLWKYTTGGSSFSSPVFVNGWLYCGSTDGKLYAFSL